MNDTWAFRLSFSTFHLLFGLGIAWVRDLSLLPGPCPFFSYVCGLASAPAMSLHYSCMSLHYSCYDITYPFTLLLPLGLRVEAPASPFLTFFLLLGFTGQHSRWASLFHVLGFLGSFNSLGFLGPFPSSLPLSFPWIFAKSFGFP